MTFLPTSLTDLPSSSNPATYTDDSYIADMSYSSSTTDNTSSTTDTPSSTTDNTPSSTTDTTSSTTDNTPSASNHYLHILNKHLTRIQIPLPRSKTYEKTETLAGTQFKVGLTISAYSLEKVGVGGTIQEAKNNAAKELITEIEKLSHRQKVLGEASLGGRAQKKNYTSLLHELQQKRKLSKPSYQVIQRPRGSDPDFMVELTLGSRATQGRGSNKKVAKLAASSKMYRILRKEFYEEDVISDDDSPESLYSSLQLPTSSESEDTAPVSYSYSDLTEFQGTVRSEIVSEYGSIAEVRGCQAMLTELPDMSELGLTTSQIIEEVSDYHPVRYEIGSTWRFSNILLAKVRQEGSVEIVFQKIKEVENVTRSFLSFLTITSKCSGHLKYLNVSHGITLESASESVAYVTLRHAESLGAGLLGLLHSESDAEY